MMKFAIVVNGAPYSSQAPLTALRFARACLASGHDIYRVFFYHDGVYTGHRQAVPPQDETDILEQWIALKREHGVELIVCVASALRRGMLDDNEAQRYEKQGPSLAPEFEISGLGQLIDAGLNADRLVKFGA